MHCHRTGHFKVSRGEGKSLGPSTSCNGGNTYRLASPEAGTSLILSSGAPEPRALRVSISGMWEKVASALHGGRKSWFPHPPSTYFSRTSLRSFSTRFWNNSVEEGEETLGDERATAGVLWNIAAREAGGPWRAGRKRWTRR